MSQRLRNFCRDQRGATSIEYSLIASLIFVVIVVAVMAVGEKNRAVFETVAKAISEATSGPSAPEGEPEGDG